MIAHAFPPTLGGTETHLWDVCRRLAAAGDGVTCLVGGVTGEADTEGIRIRRHELLTAASMLSARHGMAADECVGQSVASLGALISATADAMAPDVIHLHNAHHFGPELAAAAFAAADGRPLVNSVHDRVGDHLHLTVLDLPWRRVVYASSFLLRALPTPNPSVVIRLGVDLDVFAPDGDRAPELCALERPVVFHPARLLRWKGVEVGLAAFIRLRRMLGRGTLVMCGSEDVIADVDDVRDLRSELEGRARHAGVGDHVRFMEFPRDRIAAAYRAADLVWYPTLDEEPLGLVPLEAIACGTPVVVTASGGMLETIGDGRCGVVVERGDVDALTAAAYRVLTDRAFRAALVAAGRARAVSSHDVRDNVRRLQELYAELAAA
jgi:glycogen synthase